MTFFGESRARDFVKFVESMKFRFLNKTIENRRFDYQPMHYDERKEWLNQKRELYRKIENNELTAEERRSMLKDNLRKEYGRAEFRKGQQRTSNIRILILIALIVGLGYFVFNGIDEVDAIVKELW